MAEPCAARSASDTRNASTMIGSPVAQQCVGQRLADARLGEDPGEGATGAGDEDDDRCRRKRRLEDVGDVCAAPAAADAEEEAGEQYRDQQREDRRADEAEYVARRRSRGKHRRCGRAEADHDEGGEDERQDHRRRRRRLRACGGARHRRSGSCADAAPVPVSSPPPKSSNITLGRGEHRVVLAVQPLRDEVRQHAQGNSDRDAEQSQRPDIRAEECGAADDSRMRRHGDVDGEHDPAIGSPNLTGLSPAAWLKP